MSEVLGVLASGVALAQLAGAVISNGMKLKQLFNEVKEVPETISYLLEQIDILDPMLWAIDDDRARQLLPDTISTSEVFVQKSVQICQKVLHQLTQLLEDLTAQIQSSRMLYRSIGKVKVLLKKEVLVRYEKRLDMALRLLSSSQQMYMM